MAGFYKGSTTKPTYGSSGAPAAFGATLDQAMLTSLLAPYGGIITPQSLQQLNPHLAPYGAALQFDQGGALKPRIFFTDGTTIDFGDFGGPVSDWANRGIDPNIIEHYRTGYITPGGLGKPTSTAGFTLPPPTTVLGGAFSGFGSSSSQKKGDSELADAYAAARAAGIRQGKKTRSLGRHTTILAGFGAGEPATSRPSILGY